MMAKMSGLPANCLLPVAIDAPNLALVDLGPKVRQGVLEEGEGDHAFAPFRPDVVEFEDDYICFSTADARGVRQVIEEVTEVPSLNRTVGGHARLKVQAPRSARSPIRAPAMAIRTDDLTARHLGLDSRKRIALVHQGGDPRSLRLDMVELQDEGICKAAVRATRRGKQAEDVLPCFRPSALACRAALTAVQLSALAYVGRATLLAPGLARVEIGRRQALLATPTMPRFGGYGCRLRWRRACWVRRTDASGPKAGRTKRHSKLPRERAHRPSLRAKSAGLALLGCFAGGHTNTCSGKART
jgi:hypothetical protein